MRLHRSADDLELEAELAEPVMTTRLQDDGTSFAMRSLVATLSCAAGAIHLVMVPDHSQESLRFGIAFAVAGWSQLAIGAGVLARPSQLWLKIAIALNIVFFALWVVSRTAGLPSWTGDGGVEEVSSVDLLCAILEAALIIAAIAMLVAPGLLSNWKRHVLAFGAIVPLAILVATTAVLVSPSTAEHSHGTAEPETADGHTHSDAEAASPSANGVPTTERTHDEATTGTAEHAHDPTAATDASESVDHPHDPAVTEMSGPVAHNHDTAVTSDPAVTDTDTGEHQHASSDITYSELPPETKAQVDEVIALWANRYPTGADALADGWRKSTKSLYGIGAHYTRTSGLVVLAAADLDLLQPNILLFDGEGPDAKFAGVSYVTNGVPAGFAGEFDTWHGHTSVCLAQGSVVSLIEEVSDVWLSEADCVDRGGEVLPLAGANQMAHLWIGPSYIDSGPIMSHDHPLLLDGYNPQRDL